jgi:hypothetical protein
VAAAEAAAAEEEAEAAVGDKQTIN